MESKVEPQAYRVPKLRPSGGIVGLPPKGQQDDALNSADIAKSISELVAAHIFTDGKALGVEIGPHDFGRDGQNG
jgi:hypothetical protein